MTARNLLPVVVAVALGPEAAGLLKAAVLPFTPILTLFAGLRLVALPAMQRAAELGWGPDGASVLDRLVARLVAGYGLVAATGAGLTVVGLAALIERGVSLGSIDVGLARWGAVITVVTIVVRPLAEAVGFGRPDVVVVRRRLLELAVEWGGAFAAAAIAGSDRIVVGWATGMALGGLVWVLTALRPGRRHRPAEVALATS